MFQTCETLIQTAQHALSESEVGFHGPRYRKQPIDRATQERHVLFLSTAIMISLWYDIMVSFAQECSLRTMATFVCRLHFIQ